MKILVSPFDASRDPPLGGSCEEPSRTTSMREKKLMAAQRRQRNRLESDAAVLAKGESGARHQKQEWVMSMSIHTSRRDSDSRLSELCSAIGNQLRANYVTTLAEPLPRELRDLIAQLVAFECRNRESDTRPVEALQSVMAEAAKQPQSTGGSTGRKTDYMG